MSVLSWTAPTNASVAAPRSKREVIPALTGLRFVAAGLVVVSHLTFDMPEGLAHRLLEDLARPGMALFFVLSEFVMWLNYAEPIAAGEPGALRSFALARFARLYPLYFVVILGALAMAYIVFGWSTMKDDLPGALYFLTGIAAWIPSDHIIVKSVTYVTHLWSISVEAFFYLIFPAVVFALARIRRARTIALAALVNAIVGGVIFYLVFAHSHWIMADIAPGLSRVDGWQWVTYYSPYMRLPEFLAGCLACYLYLTVRNRRPTSARMAPLLAYASVASIFVLPVLTELLPSSSNPAIYFVLIHEIPLVTFPALLYFLARYGSKLRDALSWQPVVDGGQISYSLYLLHPLIIVGIFASLNALHVSGPTRLIEFVFIVVALSFFASSATYRWIEVPARRWMRGAGRKVPQPGASGASALAPALMATTRPSN